MSSTVLRALVDLVPVGLTPRVTLGLADDLLAGLAAGRFDQVVSTVRPRVRGITATPLFDEEFVLIAAPDQADHAPSQLPNHSSVATIARTCRLIQSLQFEPRQVGLTCQHANRSVLVPGHEVSVCSARECRR